MEKPFTTLADLRTEMDVLKIRQFQQEEALKEKFSNPSAIFSTVSSLFKNNHNPAGASKKSSSLLQSILNQDMVTNLTRVTLPLLLNIFVFKRSNFLTKTIVTFLSAKAAKSVNAEKVSGVIDKAKSWFNHKKQVRTQRAYSKAITTDYGIPPDSEAY
jgi:hypothetical protein